MKKVYLVHGWGGSSSGGWFDWLKIGGKKRIEVQAFDMPDTDNPKIEAWVNFLEEKISDIDEETFFVGHSIGCQTILRFLEKLPENIRVGGCIFVAGWFNLNDETYEDNEDKETAKPWLETPIDFGKIKKHTQNFLAIFSDDDPYVPLSDVELFKEKLNAEIIIKNNKGHFTEEKEIKEVLDFILK